jgi:arsenite methyltransferase
MSREPWTHQRNAMAVVPDKAQCGDILEDHGFISVRSTNFGTIQWVRGKRQSHSAPNGDRLT